VFFAAFSIQNIYFQLLLLHVIKLSFQLFLGLLASLHIGIEIVPLFRLLEPGVFYLLLQVLDLLAHSFLFILELLLFEYSFSSLGTS
jgi:hypothetical protein